MHCSGGLPSFFLGVSSWFRGSALEEGVYSQGVRSEGGWCIPACNGQTPPCEQNSWYTLLKIVPCPNFVAGGYNGFTSLSWTVHTILYILSMADLGFPAGGANCLRGGTNLLFCFFCRKLHENERIRTESGSSTCRLQLHIRHCL